MKRFAYLKKPNTNIDETEVKKNDGESFIAHERTKGGNR